jgi:xylulokinase
MDSSTAAQCRHREAAVGGALQLARLTGSRAYERFTGNQIAKVASENGLGDVERISLVSSFVASLWVGKYSGIDSSDAGGMNLMDLRSKEWDSAMLAVTTPLLPHALASLLGPIVEPHSIVGTVHDYFVRRYGFSANTFVVASSGDNPNALAGLGLSRAGDIAISLGSSDTVFGITTEPRPATEGHIFVSPVDPNAFMVMLVYKNGGVVRQHLRDKYTEGSWAKFSAALEDTPAGNGGHLGLFIEDPEITPAINRTGEYRFRPVGSGVERTHRFPDANMNVRAAVEGRLLSMRAHAENLGLPPPRTLLATGGGSQNQAVLQVMADVWGVPVFVEQQPDAASLGAALRAAHGLRCHEQRTFVAFAEACGSAFHRKLRATPGLPDVHELYTAMLPQYREVEEGLARKA